MTAEAFGRKGSVDGAALAARRAAFLAAERARAQRAGDDGVRPVPAFVLKKSAGTAYLLWFLLGCFSAHRFYLGFSTSAAIQAALLPITWALIASGSLAAFVAMAASALWFLADAFLIPGLCREANERLRRRAVSFA